MIRISLALGLGLLSCSSFAQSDRSHSRYCHNIPKLEKTLSKNPSNRSLIYRACKTGDSEAFHELGIRAQGTIGHVAAAHLFKKACNLGNGASCIKSSRTNSPNPLRDLKLACHNDVKTGCAQLGIFYLSGKKFKESNRAFQLSCEAGDKESCFMVGRTLEKAGFYLKAAEAHAKSCDRFQVAKSCIQAAKLMEKNVTRKPGSVKHYLKKSCDQGIEQGCALLNSKKSVPQE